MRPPAFSTLEAYEREVAAEQAVKDGGEQSSPASIPDRRATGRARHREGPGEQVAYSGGRAPAPPEHHRRRILRALGRTPDQGKPEGMSVSSIETQPPIEKTDMRCPTPNRNQFRRPDGRLITRDMPCDRKTCPVCGPRLQRELVATWAHAMGSDPVYRLVVAEAEPARMRRRKAYRGKELAHLPLPTGRAVYTNVATPGAELVTDKVAALTSDVEADPGDPRRHRSKLSAGWAAVAADAKAEAEARRERWEWLGRVSRPLEQVEMAARELGIFVGRTEDMVISDAPPDMPTLVRYLKLIGCRGAWEEWINPRARAA